MTSEEKRPASGDLPSTKKSPALFGVRSRIFKILLLSLLAVCSLAVAWNNAAKNEGKDFYQFWAVGESLNPPPSNIYANDTRKRLGEAFLEKAEQSANTNLIAVAGYRDGLQTYSTPFLYSTFRIFSTGNYDTDLRHYRLLMLGALALGIFMFCRLSNLSWTIASIILAIVCIWFDPLASDLYVGNVNSLQFGALAIYLWTITRMRWRFRDFIGGAILGLTLAFKPNLVFIIAPLAAYWIFGKNFRRLWFHAGGGIAGGAFAILFAIVSFHDADCWNEWLASLRTLSDEKVIPIQNGNFSPAEIIFELFHLNLTLLLVIVFTGLAIWRLWNFQRRQKPGDQMEIFVIAIGCLLAVIASRLTWFHYYVLTIPAFIFLLPAATARRPDFNSILRLVPSALAFAALTPIPSLICAPGMNAQAVLAVSAALLLFLSLLIFPQRNPPTEPA